MDREVSRSAVGVTLGRAVSALTVLGAAGLLGALGGCSSDDSAAVSDAGLGGADGSLVDTGTSADAVPLDSGDTADATGVNDAGAPDVTADTAPTTQSVSINFKAMIGSEAFSCDASKTYAGIGTTGAKVSMLDFRFYVHDVRLLTATGTEVPVTLTQDGIWQTAGTALLDFENNTGNCIDGTTRTNESVKGTVPAGTYTGLAFDLGVPFAQDHQDYSTAPSPLNLSALFWGWNIGYKFLKVEARPVTDGGMAMGPGGGDAGGMAMGSGDAGGMAMGTDGDGGTMDMGTGTFYVHLGSTDCVGDPTDGGAPVSACGRPDVPSVRLTGFDPTKNSVVADFAALASKSNLEQPDLGGAPGCMSGTDDPECIPIFEGLGIDFDSGAPVVGPPQRFFKVQ